MKEQVEEFGLGAVQREVPELWVGAGELLEPVLQQDDLGGVALLRLLGLLLVVGAQALHLLLVALLQLGLSLLELRPKALGGVGLRRQHLASSLLAIYE